ncbi:hypothetical protein [uncultured Enterovirga sp.]|uniref:hypothetical protein n=1 Tax=uncultured Enterovirga sp. TaxID=2026352 RepID=UPI0035CA0EAE
MPALARSLLAITFVAFSGAALAAGSSAPYAPDPGLRTDTPAQLTARIRRACSATQARIQNVSTGQVERGCGCYATRVMRSLTPPEVEAYRMTGVFNDTARGKAISAIDACRLQRPV